MKGESGCAFFPAYLHNCARSYTKNLSLKLHRQVYEYKKTTQKNVQSFLRGIDIDTSAKKRKLLQDEQKIRHTFHIDNTLLHRSWCLHETVSVLKLTLPPIIKES